jgi:hypothetical protein
MTMIIIIIIVVIIIIIIIIIHELYKLTFPHLIIMVIVCLYLQERIASEAMNAELNESRNCTVMVTRTCNRNVQFPAS